MDKPGPGRDMADVRYSQTIGFERPDLTVHLVERTRRFHVAHRGLRRFAPDHPGKAGFARQPFAGAAGHVKAFAPRLASDRAGTMGRAVRPEDRLDLLHQCRITPDAILQQWWVEPSASARRRRCEGRGHH